MPRGRAQAGRPERLTKYFWSGDGQILYAGAVDVTSRNQLFAVWRYDSTWWVIDSLAIANVFNPYVAPDRSLPQNNNRLTLTSGPLNGNHLFKISPANLMG